MKPIPRMTAAEALARIDSSPCLAFYSTLFGGIVQGSEAMVVPVDDHLVHRGDGVFETIKLYHGVPYQLTEHLQRLARSAASIGIESPLDEAELAAVVMALAEVAGEPSALIRLLLSRGPGGFSVNPYESSGSQIYAALYLAQPAFMDRVPEGGRVITSTIPVKPGVLARAKTCNYLPNALMKKEAVDAGVHFAVSLDESGQVAESFTENLCLVQDGRLIRPPGDRILLGTTMMRCFELAAADGIPTEERSFDLDTVKAAEEVLIFGTTAEVTAVVEWDGESVGGGAPGPMHRQLLELLQADIANACKRAD